GPAVTESTVPAIQQSDALAGGFDAAAHAVERSAQGIATALPESMTTAADGVDAASQVMLGSLDQLPPQFETTASTSGATTDRWMDELHNSVDPGMAQLVTDSQTNLSQIPPVFQQTTSDANQEADSGLATVVTTFDQ